MEDEDISLGLNSNEELVSVQGQDGQQYVVLEVIQLEVNSNLHQQSKSGLLNILFDFQGEGGEEDEATMMEVEGAGDMDGSLMEGDGNTMTSLDGTHSPQLNELTKFNN